MMSEKPKRPAAFIKERGLGRAVAAFIGVYAIVLALGLLATQFGIHFGNIGLLTLAIAILAAALAYFGRI
jgi:hypothetical protein